MAIQNRRGSYKDLDPDKLLPGEYAIVLQDDPHCSDGRAAYLCFEAGNVKRLATYEDMEENIAHATEEIIADRDQIAENKKGISELKGDIGKFTAIEKSINIFNPNDNRITKSAQIKSDGTIGVSSAFDGINITDFIDISKTQSSILRQTSVFTNVVAEYKADGTFIKKTSINKENPLTLDANTEKIRFQYYVDTLPNMLYQSEKEESYVDYEVKISIKDSAIPDSIARKTDLNSFQNELDYLKPEYEMTNYMLFVDIYENKKYENGVITDYQHGNATSMTRLEKESNMYAANAVGQAVFFDKDKEYISSIELKYGVPILTTQYPTNAVYVAFWYMRDYMQGNTMYVIRKDNYELRSKKFTTYTKKKVGERPIINIYTTDTETEVLIKLVDAMITGDCDVFFEHGTYTFNDVFVTLYETYGYRGYCELPIGGNCRYYLNGSTLIGKGDAIKAKNYDVTINLLSCIESKLAQGFELYDGTLIGNGINYVVHDECGAKDGWYIHKYHNIKFQSITGISTNNLRRCIGGGTGLHGEVIIENCTFFTDWDTKDAGFHGNYSTDADCDFVVRVANCYFENKFEIGNLGENQTAHIDFCGNTSKDNPTSDAQIGTKGAWSVRAWCNEVHQ